MINKWNEVSQITFKEIFDSFWNGKFPGKVLEIQNLTSIYCKVPSIRIYFGEGIKMEEWKEYNSDIYNLLGNLGKDHGIDSFKEVQKDSKLSMCITEGSPRITPLGAAPEHYGILMKTCFGFPGKGAIGLAENLKPMSTWFYRDGEKYICNVKSDPGIDSENMKFRIRAMDVDDWRREIEYYCKNKSFQEDFIKDDIIKDNIDIIGFN